MISVNEAKKLIASNSVYGKPRLSALTEVAGLISAEDSFSVTDIPAFPQSSMDGYAVAASGLKQFSRFRIVGEMAAGTDSGFRISDSETARIFTGAPLPQGADTVIRQEDVRVEDGFMVFDGKDFVTGTNMRAPGAEIKTGALALQAGSLLTPAAIGFLAGTGKAEVKVYPAPRVRIVITGNELQSPGTALKYGQVYESNSYSLKAALQQWGVQDIIVSNAGDTLESLKKVLAEISDETDILLMTGGVSVGDYDLVAEALLSAGVVKIFHSVKQKPGKPLYFGKKGDTMVFGLPGNPASVLTCFYEYVSISIEKILHREPVVKSVKAVLKSSFRKPEGLTCFLKAVCDGQYVHLQDGQESYRLSSYATANCLVIAEESRKEYGAGETVEVHFLPGIF